MRSVKRLPFYLVFDGQSLNRTGGYPTKVRASLASLTGLTLPFRNVAVQGLDLEMPGNGDLTASFSWRTAPYAKVAETNVLLLNACQTGLNTGDSAATLRTDAANYATTARSVGFDLVLMVTVPAASSSYYDANAETERDALNAGLLSTGVTSGDFDAVADIATAIDAVADPDGTDPTYYADVVHWTAAGAQVAADTVGPVLADMLGL